jgi:hypothetical protein
MKKLTLLASGIVLLSLAACTKSATVNPTPLTKPIKDTIDAHAKIITLTKPIKDTIDVHSKISPLTKPKDTIDAHSLIIPLTKPIKDTIDVR